MAEFQTLPDEINETTPGVKAARAVQQLSISKAEAGRRFGLSRAGVYYALQRIDRLERKAAARAPIAPVVTPPVSMTRELAGASRKPARSRPAPIVHRDVTPAYMAPEHCSAQCHCNLLVTPELARTAPALWRTAPPPPEPRGNAFQRAGQAARYVHGLPPLVPCTWWRAARLFRVDESAVQATYRELFPQSRRFRVA